MILASGHVSERPFARTIYSIAARRFTGDLVFTEEGRRYAIAWDNGAIIGAESPLPTDSAGRIAVAGGFASSSVVNMSLAQMPKRPGVEQIDILVELAQLSADREAALRRRVMLHRAARPFALQDARFELDDQRNVRFEMVAPIDARHLIYHGLRSHYDDERLEREIASLSGKQVGLAPDGFGALVHFGFGDEEQAILAILRDRMIAIDELAAATGREPRTVRALVYALGACDCLAVSGAVPRAITAAPTQPMAEMPSGPFVSGATPARAIQAPPRERMITFTTPPAASSATTPPPAARAATTPPPDAVPVPVARTTTAPLSTAARASTAPPPAARASTAPPPAARASTAPPPERSSVTIPPRRAATVSGAPAPAAPLRANTPITPRTLTAPHGMPSLGGGPTRARTTSAPPGDPAADEARALVKEKLALLDGQGTHFSILGVASGAAAGEIRTAYFSLAKRMHPDRLRAVGVPDLNGEIQRLFSAINQAFAVLSDPTKRKEYEAFIASGGTAAKEKADAQAEQMAARFFGAEEAFRKGEMALRRSSFEQARGFFEEAVTLNPEEAEHQAMLAWATWLSADNKPAVQDGVQKRFAQAIKLSPACVPAHFYRGLVAKQSGRDDVAIECFRKVLDLRPEHNEANLELRLLLSRSGRRRESGGLLDKLKRK